MKKYRWDAIIDRVDKNKEITIVEIGVWRGGLSKKLLEALPKMFLIQVDRWEKYSNEEIEAEVNSRMSRYPQERFNIAYNENIENISPYLKRVKIIKLDSTIAANTIKNKTIDLIFFDAAHNCKKCENDFFAWLPKIKSGGYIGGHDYRREGVKKAVDLIFGNKVKEDIGKTWWVKI